MTEINYQVFDDVSGLPVHSLSDKFIREIAQKENKSLSEVFKEMKETINKTKIVYFLSFNKEKIIPIAKGGLFKCPGEYYDNYPDAVNALINLGNDV